jgi:hypothetical protein
MALSELHGHVAKVALAAAAGHGFAPGGGNALLAHGIISRRWRQVLLCTRRPSRELTWSASGAPIWVYSLSACCQWSAACASWPSE